MVENAKLHDTIQDSDRAMDREEFSTAVVILTLSNAAG